MLLDLATEIPDLDIADAPSAPARPAATLDPLTAQVVALARREGLRSAHEPTRPGRLLTRLFGLKVAAPLADPRLETVRRFCILARHRDPLTPALRAELSDAGYSDDQIALIEASID